MRARATILGTVALTTGLVFALPGSPAVAVPTSCPASSSSKPGSIPWQVRQASGLTTTTGSPGVLFTHNDRGIRDNPANGEDTDSATVWAMRTDGTLLARIVLTNGGAPIQYFDTEAISTQRGPGGERIVLADTGTNADDRVTVAVYRFQPPMINANVVPQVVPTITVSAEVIPVEYYNKVTGGTAVKLNVEAFAMDADGNGWFIPRNSTRPYAYEATANALNAASTSGTPARAVRVTQLLIQGPVTDTSIAPGGRRLLVKTMDQVYAYPLASASGANVSAAFGANPCLVITAATNKSAGYGEAITARDDGGSYTVAEGAKGARGTAVSPIWSLNA
jgi:hypothetical protein